MLQKGPEIVKAAKMITVVIGSKPVHSVRHLAVKNISILSTGQYLHSMRYFGYYLLWYTHVYVPESSDLIFRPLSCPSAVVDTCPE